MFYYVHLAPCQTHGVRTDRRGGCRGRLPSLVFPPHLSLARQGSGGGGLGQAPGRQVRCLLIQRTRKEEADGVDHGDGNAQQGAASV